MLLRGEHELDRERQMVRPDVRPDAARGETFHQDAGGPPAPEAPGDSVTELGVEIDNAFYNWAGGTRKSAVRSVEKVMIDVNEIYSADVGIVFVPTYYIVRKTAGGLVHSDADAAESAPAPAAGGEA